jgi:hypothetical protein
MYDTLGNPFLTEVCDLFRSMKSSSSAGPRPPAFSEFSLSKIGALSTVQSMKHLTSAAFLSDSKIKTPVYSRRQLSGLGTGVSGYRSGSGRQRLDVLVATKLLPEELVPIEMVGKMVLDRNPDNFFAETEHVQMMVPKGRDNYEPNSISAAGPRETPSGLRKPFIATEGT